jgi:putative membrane protein
VSNLGLEEYIFENSESWAKTLISLGILAIALFVLVILMISWVASILAFAMKNYNFSIMTHGDRIEITRGLLSRVGIQVNLKRIQSLYVKQGIISRLFGYASIEAKLAVSEVGKEKSDPGHSPGSVTLHPFIKLDRVNDYIAAFLPEYAVRPEGMASLPRAALRRSIIRYGRNTLIFFGVPVSILLGILTAFSDLPRQLISLAAVACFLFFAFMLLTGWRAWAGRGISIANDFFAIRKGAYGRTWIFVPRRKIQIAEAGQNPFQRRLKLVTVSATTAASSLSSVALIDVSELQAEAFFDLVQRRLGAAPKGSAFVM